MVKVGFLEDEPIILAAVGVKISQTPFEKGSIRDIYEERRADKEESKKLVNEIMTKHRHLILGDFLPHAIILEDISRLAAIYIWRMVNVNNLVFGAGIEASFKVIKPNRYNEAVSNFGEMAFEAYERAVSGGVPEQDARYLLPEGVLTRMIFSSTPRYLEKLANALKNTSLQEFKEIGEKVETLVKKEFGLELLQETLPSEWKFWGKEEIRQRTSVVYRGDIYALSIDTEVSGSLAMYAQLVRQRLLLCEIEPLEGISKRGTFVVPSTFSEAAREDYQEIAKEVKQKQIALIEKRDSNFVYYLLLGQEAKAMMYGKGFAVIETSRARSEGVA
ncbi:FAD-dependent thymidylate synthase [Candidatus Parcubacteria bacterium]|nr:FAD-dependent thymidylate synthase [Candidatus Parcubacteria bacterium]